MASGPIESVTINGRRFAVDGEVDAALALPGYTNEVKANGDRTQRLVKSVKPGRMNALPLIMDDARDDEKFIQEVMDLNIFVPIEITDVNTNVWSGNGQIVEDPETSKKEGTKEVNLMGDIRKQ